MITLYGSETVVCDVSRVTIDLKILIIHKLYSVRENVHELRIRLRPVTAQRPNFSHSLPPGGYVFEELFPTSCRKINDHNRLGKNGGRYAVMDEKMCTFSRGTEYSNYSSKIQFS